MGESVVNPALSTVAKDMLGLGLAALAHANRHAAYYNPDNDKWSELSVLQAAHATEIIIKARIAQEHPLLIFEDFPKESSTNAETSLTLDALFEQGRTVQWSDLPNRLWATTGKTVPNVEMFRKFGKLRNGVQHFGSIPDKIDTAYEVLNFIFSVVDPFINASWGLFAVDYDEDHASQENFPCTLLHREILFLVSKDVARYSEYWEVDWSSLERNYSSEMQKRIKTALQS
jgi:hypothetical protein